MKLQDRNGIDTKERQHLMNVVFGQDGLTNADTTLMLEERSTMVTEEMKEYPALCQYYEKQMKPRIQSFVHEPCRNQKEFDQPLWTSCNNVAPVTNLRLGRATTRSHSSQWSKKKVAVET